MPAFLEGLASTEPVQLVATQQTARMRLIVRLRAENRGGQPDAGDQLARQHFGRVIGVDAALTRYQHRPAVKNAKPRGRTHLPQ